MLFLLACLVNTPTNMSFKHTYTHTYVRVYVYVRTLTPSLSHRRQCFCNVKCWFCADGSHCSQDAQGGEEEVGGAGWVGSQVTALQGAVDTSTWRQEGESITTF